ncbi:MAG: hypothetical protein JWR16_362 [Nevskia sp.]|nr:hypothetical protein [Nevskia sp.]
MHKLIVIILLCAIGGTANAQLTGRKIGGSDTGSADAEGAAATLAVESHKFYVGAEYTQSRLSVSDSSKAGGIPEDDFDGLFVDIRAGYRILSALGLEFHYGVPVSDTGSSGDIKQNHYYGIFAVPTATLFERFELGFPVGYTFSKVSHRDDDGTREHKTLDSVAFGMNIEVPIRQFWDVLPDVRVVGGGMVYDHKSSARYYGFHYGLRYDFGF